MGVRGQTRAVILPTVGELLPVAAAVALSPIPVVGVVVVLGTPRARRVAPAFGLGWLLGLTAVTTVVVLVARGIGVDDPGSDAATGFAWGRVAVGVLLLGLAVKTWATRPRDGDERPRPTWLDRMDTLTPTGALGLGAALGSANPKNLALAAAAGATIAQAGLDTAQTVAVVALFVLLASTSVVGAVVWFLVAPHSAAGPLGAVERFMERHNSAIVIVVLVIFGLSLLGEGLGTALR